MCNAKSSVIANVDEDSINEEISSMDSNLSTNSEEDSYSKRFNYIMEHHTRLIEKGKKVPKKLNDEQLNELLNLPNDKKLGQKIRSKLGFYGHVEELKRQKFWVKKTKILDEKISDKKEKLEYIHQEFQKILKEYNLDDVTLNDSQIEQMLLHKNLWRIDRDLKFFVKNIFRKKNEKIKKNNAVNVNKISRLDGDSLFYRVRSSYCKTILRCRTLPHFNFDQPLVFDFGYNHLMSPKEQSLLARQILELQSVNVSLVDPFPLYFHNYDKNSFLSRKISQSVDIDEVPVIFTDEEVDVHLPEKKLCYLSPDSQNDMERFDGDTTYIIGSLVDLSGQGPLSYVKADALGIPTVRLPIDKYVKWKGGTKYLNLITLLFILHDLKLTSKYIYHFLYNSIPKLD